MTFKHILSHVDPKLVQVQELEKCLLEIHTNHKKGVSKITFAASADVITANDLMYGGKADRMRGLVVWIPNAEITRLQSAKKTSAASQLRVLRAKH